MQSILMRYPFLLIVTAGLLLPALASAQGYISRLLHHPVPGGVAVVDLGLANESPRAFYKDDTVMVLRDSDDAWIAVVGTALKPAVGQIGTPAARESGGQYGPIPGVAGTSTTNHHPTP